MGQPRRPDQSFDPPGNAAPVSSQAGIFRGRLVIVTGPNGAVVGVFVYAPGTTPALGNPPIASLTNSTTDPYGNPVQPSVAAYGPTVAGGVSPATIFMDVVSNALSLFFSTGAASEVAPGAHLFTTVFNAGTSSEQLELAIIGPTSTASNARVDIQQLSDGASSPGIATGFLLYFDTAGGQHQLADWGQHGFGGLIVQKLVGAQPGTIDTTLAAETWHNLSLVGGVFTAGTVTPQYRFEPVGTAGIVRLRGNGTLAANEPANTQIASLPAGYHPANNTFLVAGNNLSGATAVAADLSINTSGAMFITQAGTNGNEVIFDGLTFPLD